MTAEEFGEKVIVVDEIINNKPCNYRKGYKQGTVDCINCRYNRMFHPQTMARGKFCSARNFISKK